MPLSTLRCQPSPAAQGMIMAGADLLARLDGVLERGSGRWIARCPAHEDRSPSLSIRELDDGTILLHDFGGCDPLSVVRAVGLEFRDLFPGREMRRVRGRARGVPRFAAADALEALDHECTVVAIIAADMLEHREIDTETWERLATAVRRIGAARGMCCPARIAP